jgi:hypothetical protein
MRASTANGGTKVRLLRSLILVVFGSGLAWAAVQFSAPAPATLRQADPAAPAGAGEAAVDAAEADQQPDPAMDDPANDQGDDQTSEGTGAADEAAPVRELSEAELEAEIAAAEAAVSGGAPADVRNRAAEKPLPADLPVALPSDI